MLILSSTALTDRVFMHTQCLRVLRSRAEVEIWSPSARAEQYRSAWDVVDARVRPMPPVGALKEFPVNFLRRVNEAAWDARQRARCRESMRRHSSNVGLLRRVQRAAGRVVASLGQEQRLEDAIERMMLAANRSPAAGELLATNRPDLVLSTGPFQFVAPGITALAQRSGIPVLAMVPSWDNLSTKNRLVLKYDGYIVWSEWQKEELHRYYPDSRRKPVYVVGAPQFDIFFDPRFHGPRESFLREQGLDPARKTILYALGSPNLLPGEIFGALDLARRVADGRLGPVQMIVRPHPVFDRGEFQARFEGLRHVVVQHPAGESRVSERSQDETQAREWVNTFRHVDVVVNLSSTVTVDAAVLDRPVVNLNYDPAPGAPQQQFIEEINASWEHFSPIAQSGGLWLSRDADETALAVRTYLEQPELHRERRRWIAERVCQYLDGRCGERLADALLDFLSSPTAAEASRGG
ncbi:MAG: CDP-glycerol glycerophosphotransferase family protein [Armatimonadota bacterium]